MNKVLTVGQEASALDIFLSANGSSVSGKYVGFQLFDAADAPAVSGVALNPAFGQYVGSGTIPAGFQLGGWHVHWTIVTLTNSVLFATEPFTVQDVTVSIGFVPDTDQTSPIYEAVKIDIGDPEGYVFDDDFLSRVLVKAVRRLNHKLGLSITSRPRGIAGGFGGPRLKISPIVVDINAGTVTPNNDELVDLVILQMELIILQGETSALKRLAATSASGPYAILVAGAQKDGVTVQNADGVMISIGASRLNNRVALHKMDLDSRERELDDAIKLFWARQTSSYGKMIW